MIVALLILAIAFIVGFTIYSIKHKDTLTLGSTDKNNFWRLSK